MACHNKALNILASKLGLANEYRVLSKAAEFDRLLQTKSTTGSNMSDTSKLIICLDLAAEMFGANLDIKSAIRFSGLRPTLYSNNKKMIKMLLEIDDENMTTSFLCTTLQCPEVQELADEILLAYQKYSKFEIDLSLPQYVAMAVFHACRKSKVKVSKSKIIEKSKLKPAQWAKLDTEWTKLADEKFPTQKTVRGRVPTSITQTESEKSETDVKVSGKEDPVECKLEPYEDWKRRMLEKAYAQVKMLKEQKSMEVDDSEEDNIPIYQVEKKYKRKSPRLTPKKSPVYKTSKKTGGIRLRFSLK